MELRALLSHCDPAFVSRLDVNADFAMARLVCVPKVGCSRPDQPPRHARYMLIRRYQNQNVKISTTH